jgi:hypothetical protein
MLTALLAGCALQVERSLSPGQLKGTAFYVSGGRQLAAAEATVTLEQSPLTATTDSAGNFQFTGLPAGTYAIRISWFPPGRSTAVGIHMTGISIPLHDAVDLGKFALTPLGTLLGTVTVDGSTPGPGAIAAITGLMETRVAGGMYSFPMLPPGSYEVAVMDTNSVGEVIATAPVTVQVLSSQDAIAPPATLSDQTGVATTGAVQGLVQIGGASSSAGALVTFSGSGPSLTTSDSGGFSSGGVAPGVYTATFSKSGYRTVVVPHIIVGAGTSVVPPVTLLPGTSDIPDAGPASCFADSECQAASCIGGLCRAAVIGASCTAGSNASCGVGPAPICLNPTLGTYCSSSCSTDSDCGAGAACVTNLMSPPDAGNPDAGNPDAGTSDAGTSDAGTPDAGTPDAGTSDAGTPDAGTSDAGTSDAGTPDAGTPDAGTPDAGPPDEGNGDAGETDAGTADAGAADGGSMTSDDGGVTPAPQPAGFCVALCSSSTDCSSSSVCDTWQGTSGSFVNGCWVACQFNADCGPGETCNSFSGVCQ